MKTIELLCCMPLFPAIGLAFKSDVCGLEFRRFAFLALLLVVLQSRDGRTAYDENYGYVYNHHDTLKHICGIPNNTGRQNRTDKHQCGRQKAEAGDEGLAGLTLHDKSQAALAVLVIAEQCRKRKQGQCSGNENGTNIAEGCENGVLNKAGCVGTSVCTYVGCEIDAA